jgi:hypothetical protein
VYHYRLYDPARAEDVAAGTWKSPVITFLILHSIDPHTKGFISESSIQNHCSVLIYSFRLVFLGLMRLQSDLNAFTERSDTDFDPTFKHSYAGLLTNTSNNCFEELT